jgi:hypothetical protein
MSKKVEQKPQFPSWITKPPPQIEKLLADMPDEVYHTIVKEVLSLAEPHYRQQIESEQRQKLIEEIDPRIDPFCGTRVSILRDCLSYVNCEVRNNCFWFWWQQFKGGK